MHQDSRQYEIFPDRLRLRRVDESKKLRQFYLMPCSETCLAEPSS